MEALQRVLAQRLPVRAMRFSGGGERPFSWLETASFERRNMERERERERERAVLAVCERPENCSREKRKKVAHARSPSAAIYLYRTVVFPNNAIINVES